MKKLLILFVLVLCTSVSAKIILPHIFSDGMILQRNTEVKIWGWAEPHKVIALKASWLQDSVKVKVKMNATWEITLKTTDTRGAQRISITGIDGENVYDHQEINDVLLGEVWLASGQSNMDMSASWGILNGEEETKNANFPSIRIAKAYKKMTSEPQSEVRVEWQEITPVTMPYLTSVGYFFARKLHNELDVPVGIIQSAWGGTPAEFWIPEETFEGKEVLQKEASERKVNEWNPQIKSEGFNAMINPFIPYTFKGVLWYQGESNVGSRNYDKTLTALIESWRTKWDHNFPFYIVQIAQFGKPEFADNAFVRDAQRIVNDKVENTQMVVITDVSSTDDIHPKDKTTVGERLANLALKYEYGMEIGFLGMIDSPEISSAEVNKNQLILNFDFGSGLYFKDKNSTGFEIAGADEKYYPAKAKIYLNQVILEAKEVKNPVFYRYQWSNVGASNLYNEVHMPSSVFQGKVE